MSWKATYWVKSLTKHADGTKLTARQKLVLFVLADYHHDEKGFAWVSTRRAADECVTSHKWLLAILETLEKHGTINIERREGRTSLYRFPLMKSLHQSHGTHFTSTDGVRVHQTGEVASSPKPSYPTGTDIQPEIQHAFNSAFCPADYVLDAIEEGKRTKRSTDDVLSEWRDHPEKRPF